MTDEQRKRLASEEARRIAQWRTGEPANRKRAQDGYAAFLRREFAMGTRKLLERQFTDQAARLGYVDGQNDG